MTLADLLTELTTRGALRPGVVKDMRTAIKHLAAALGHASPEQCAMDTALAEEASWAGKLEAHFATLTAQGRTISLENRRNVRNHLRVLLRAAAAQGLIHAPVPPLLRSRGPSLDDWREKRSAMNPYPETYVFRGSRNSYTLAIDKWPPDVQAAWQEYRRRCKLDVRETSLVSYEKGLCTYIGYLTNVCGGTGSLAEVFDKDRLEAFALWHGERMGRPPVSTHGRQVVIYVANFAKVLEHPTALALADLRRRIKIPDPVHIKQNHWVSLAELEEVADRCFDEARQPLVPAGRESRFPGAQRAGRFGRGLMLKLLVRMPLRQRNLREMAYGTNLRQDPRTKNWELEFRGEQLKVGTYRGRTNRYYRNISAHYPELIPWLVEWQEVHRPKLPNADRSRLVFLSQHGKPHSEKSIHTDISEAVGRYTGQLFYPHLLRTVYATEYLDANHGDFRGAATQLGNDPKTLARTYDDPDIEVQHANGADFLHNKALKRG
jgi:hypothetical protein